ncbi:MAG: anthranilate phosphoribosyltransferase [Dehalococcoidales bacterium]|jgi:anthranilate phosphoribosyltransferase|nr:anthranilate phosphoribosyltransferase [Dehalococcoidales bacterium]
MIKEAIHALVDGRSLTAEESAAVMEEIMEGQATPAQLGAFITALRIRGETPEEITGLVRVMRAKAIPVTLTDPVLDVVGTGGDGLNTFNISTTSAFVAAGAGLKVAKHGNRAASSQCGSADVLESLGIKIDLNAEQVKRCISEVGIGFMFAPAFHPAMKFAAGPRKEIGIRTVFNILGPLINPAQAQYQVIGAPSISLAEKIAHVLAKLNLRHALVVHGLIGMDELSITGKSLYWEIINGALVKTRSEITPESYGLKRAPLKSVLGGTPQENARIILEVLSGKKGPRRDIVLLNSAAALIAGEKVKSFEDGISMAESVIDQGKALAILEKLMHFSHEIAE